jgi:catechol 2,3-dioxygenase-like lactoylglutathione lyase family enzyme
MSELPELVFYDRARGWPVDRMSVGIWCRDLDQSLAFYRDGVGLSVISRNEFDADMAALFDAPSQRLRSVFLGDPHRPDAGTVELVHLGDLAAPSSTAPVGPGVLFVAFMVDVAAAVGRLERLGLARDLRRVEVPVGNIATVLDPDGVRVELIDTEPAPDEAQGRIT